MKKVVIITLVLLFLNVLNLKSNTNIDVNNKFIFSALNSISNNNFNIDFNKARELLKNAIKEKKIKNSSQRRKYLNNLSKIISNDEKFNETDFEWIIIASPFYPFFLNQPKEKIFPYFFTLIEKLDKIIVTRTNYQISLKETALRHLVYILDYNKSENPIPLYKKFIGDKNYQLSLSEEKKIKDVLLNEIKNQNYNIRNISLWGLRFFVDDAVVMEGIINIAENDSYHKQQNNIINGTYYLREQAIKLLNLTNINFNQSYNLDKFKNNWNENLFFGRKDGVLVKKGVKLNINEKLIVLARNKNVQHLSVKDKFKINYAKGLFDTEGFSKIYKNKKLYNRIGCYWGLRGAQREYFEIAKFPEQSFDYGIAIRNIPHKNSVICNSNHDIKESEIQQYLKLVNINDSKDLLLIGKKYIGNKIHKIVELSVGSPLYGGKHKIKSIIIKKFIIYKDKILEQFEFSRDRDKQEHVDTAPPELTIKNWWDTSVKTLGYISVNNGETWDVFCIDFGFEGIGYVVREIGSNKITKFDYYLYTPH